MSISCSGQAQAERERPWVQLSYSQVSAMARPKPVPPTVAKIKEVLRRERRKNRRLRAVIDELRSQIAANRRDLDLQFTRLAQVQVELDALKLMNR